MTRIPPTDEEVERLARLMYESYCDHANWKNYQGLPCPRWNDAATLGNRDATLSEAVRGHWRCVARVAFEGDYREPLPRRAIFPSGSAA